MVVPHVRRRPRVVISSLIGDCPLPVPSLSNSAKTPQRPFLRYRTWFHSTMFPLSARVSRLLRRLFLAIGRTTTTKECLSAQSAATFPFSLPQEINDMILSYLPVESVIALALTCRLIYQTIPSLRFLDDEGRLNLLVLLEKDVPHLYACHQCLRLHTWRRMAIQPDIRHPYSCGGRAYRTRTIINSRPPSRQCAINYPLARLIVNRHLYGEQHGPPPEVLNRTAMENERCLRRGVVLTQARSARVMDNELYLKTTVQVYLKESNRGVLRKRSDKVPPGDESFLRCSMTGERRPQVWRLVSEARQLMYGLTEDRTLVCQHIGSPWSATLCPPFYSGQPSDLFTSIDESLFPRTGKIRSCRYCFTDFRVDVQWYPPDSKGPKGWVVKITRWHQLGKCRSPLDAKWYNYREEEKWKITAPRMETSCSPGMIYRNWRAWGKPRHGVAEDLANELTNAAFSQAWWPIDRVYWDMIDG